MTLPTLFIHDMNIYIRVLQLGITRKLQLHKATICSQRSKIARSNSHITRRGNTISVANNDTALIPY